MQESEFGFTKSIVLSMTKRQRIQSIIMTDQKFTLVQEGSKNIKGMATAKVGGFNRLEVLMGSKDGGDHLER